MMAANSYVISTASVTFAPRVSEEQKQAGGEMALIMIKTRPSLTPSLIGGP